MAAKETVKVAGAAKPTVAAGAAKPTVAAGAAKPTVVVVVVAVAWDPEFPGSRRGCAAQC